MGPYWTAVVAATLLCLAAIVLAPTGSAAVPSSSSLQSRSDDEDTQLALEEVGRLFRRLFPLVPEKAQYFWRSSLLGGTLVLRNHEQRARPDAAAQEEESDSPRGEGKTEPGSPWRVDTQFRKRGPDCMRKCIAQGVLHPVQCHSLC